MARRRVDQPHIDSACPINELATAARDARIAGRKDEYMRTAAVVARRDGSDLGLSDSEYEFRPVAVGSQNLVAGVWSRRCDGKPTYFQKSVVDEDREVRFWEYLQSVDHRDDDSLWYRLVPPTRRRDAFGYTALLFPYIEHTRSDFRADLGRSIRALAEWAVTSFLRGDAESEFGRTAEDVRSSQRAFVHSRHEYGAVYPEMDTWAVSAAQERGAFIDRHWHVVNDRVRSLLHILAHNDAGAPNLIYESSTRRTIVIDWGSYAVAPIGRDLHTVLRHVGSQDGYRVSFLRAVVNLYADALRAGGLSVTHSDLTLAALEGFCVRYTQLIPRIKARRLHIPAQLIAIRLIRECGGPPYRRSA